ncbi:hypothetical protein QO010_000046 [Caulobacter ginsengisoli]|uniref:DUF4861 domain-containing protein n=1 Tax=Caulobacter ginsengisoli TaxID=400775 RepID=A0ABU0IMD8_9CAUL|nr:DUF6807 family protein [Caulobacter ginsengisoli]MDQ0462298.1 hypothetical protein [Caulobacter ginsengisoli]
MIRPALLVLTLLIATPALAQTPAPQTPKPLFDAQITTDGVTVLETGKPAFFFRTRAAAGTEAGRLDYLHPLYAPDGTVLTEDGAASYPQQRGAFWAWPRILVDGKPVADSWNLKGIAFTVRDTHFGPGPGGSAELVLKSDWLLTGGTEVVYAADEVTTVRIYPLKKGARRIEFDTTIISRLDGLSLAGNDDERGFGGFALRLTNASALAFASDGRPVKPGFGSLQAGTSMGFAWPGQPGLGSWGVGLACKVDGRPLRYWLLRREASVQNCVFPGRAPAVLSKGRALHLQATIVITPR